MVTGGLVIARVLLTGSRIIVVDRSLVVAMKEAVAELGLIVECVDDGRARNSVSLVEVVTNVMIKGTSIRKCSRSV